MTATPVTSDVGDARRPSTPQLASIWSHLSAGRFCPCLPCPALGLVRQPEQLGVAEGTYNASGGKVGRPHWLSCCSACVCGLAGRASDMGW